MSVRLRPLLFSLTNNHPEPGNQLGFHTDRLRGTSLGASANSVFLLRQEDQSKE
jgi:hypothetical protein